jgi:hypothetical protein
MHPRPVASRLALLVLLALPGLAGCPCNDAIAPWIEIGEGSEGFAALEDGDVLAVERGSQGGQHVWASVRGDGLHPGSPDISEGLRNDDLPWIEFALIGPDGVYSNENLLRQPLQPLPEGGYGFLERRVPFRYWSVLPDDWAEIPRAQREDEIEAMEFLLRVSIDDACGDELEDSRMVHIVFPESSEAPGRGEESR